jgi:hypothetical protein
LKKFEPKASDTLVDLAILLQIDRNHLAQALRARDSVVSLLIDACTVISEKSTTIELLKAINEELEHRIDTKAQCSCLGTVTPEDSEEDTNYPVNVP